ncbi:MAG: hypothetical protein KTR25_06465 [Myxococcales bacterium]|nr:hypothetical protein [Myxococcales bacterium]
MSLADFANIVLATIASTTTRDSWLHDVHVSISRAWRRVGPTQLAPNMDMFKLQLLAAHKRKFVILSETAEDQVLDPKDQQFSEIRDADRPYFFIKVPTS